PTTRERQPGVGAPRLPAIPQQQTIKEKNDEPVRRNERGTLPGRTRPPAGPRGPVARPGSPVLLERQGRGRLGAARLRSHALGGTPVWRDDRVPPGPRAAAGRCGAL